MTYSNPFLHKLPISAIPYKMHRGKRCLAQKLLQLPNSFTFGAPHLKYEGLFFKSIIKGAQCWVTAEGLVKEQTRLKVSALKRYHKNKEVICKKKRENYKLNPHPHRERSRQYYREDPERSKASSLKWRSQNPEAWLNTQAESYKKRALNNPSFGISLYQQAADEYKKGLITKKEYNKVCELLRCQARNNKGKDHKDKHNLDHIIPRSHGGLSEPNNLQTVSFKWNIIKGNKNRNVYNPQGNDFDVWYRWPYVFPKMHAWTTILPSDVDYQVRLADPPCILK